MSNININKPYKDLLTHDGIYKLTEISMSDAQSFLSQESRFHDNKLTQQLTQESASVATDYDRFKTIRDSFELFLEKNNFEPNKESIYKYFNRTMYKVKKREAQLANLNNILQDLKRLSKKDDFTDKLSEASLKYLAQKYKAKSQKYDVENYQHVLLRSKNDNALVKEKVEELTQIFRHYDDTMKKYQIISEVTEKELSDIQGRVDQTKLIFVKKLQHNDQLLHERRALVAQLEKSIDKQEVVKKKFHKEELKREMKEHQEREIEVAERKQAEVLHFIANKVDEDMTQCENKYQLMFQTLGTDQVERIQEKIVKEVIPYDIEKQSLQNGITDKLQQIGLLQGEKQSLQLELEKAREEYERRYQEEEFYILQKTREKEVKALELRRRKDFYITQNEVMLKLINQVRNSLDNVVRRISNNPSNDGFSARPETIIMTLPMQLSFMGVSLDKMMFHVASKFTLLNVFGSRTFARKDSLQRKTLKSMATSSKRLVTQQVKDTPSDQIVKYYYMTDLAQVSEDCLSYWLNLKNQVDKQDQKAMRKNVETMIFDQKDDDALEEDSDMDDEMMAHKTRQNLEQKEREKKTATTTLLVPAGDNFGDRKASNKAADILMYRRQKVMKVEDESDSENYIIEQRENMKHKKPEAASLKKILKEVKPIGNELFGKDEHIQTNKDIKRKWFIQNISNLRKAEKRFRKIYLQMEFSDLKQFDQIEDFFQHEMFIGKSPEEIEQKFKRMKEAQNMSRTLSLMSSDFHIQNVDSSSFKDETNYGDKNSLKQSTFYNEGKRTEKSIQKPKAAQPKKQGVSKTASHMSLKYNNSQKSLAESSNYQKGSIKSKDLERFMHVFDSKIEYLSYPVTTVNNDSHKRSIFSPPPAQTRQLLFTPQKEQIKSEDGSVEDPYQQNACGETITRGQTAASNQRRLTSQQNSRSVATLTAYKFPQIKDIKKALADPRKKSFNEDTQPQTSNKQDLRKQSLVQIQSVIDTLKQAQGPRPVTTSYGNSMFKLQNIYKLQKPSRRNIDKIAHTTSNLQFKSHSDITSL